jgi:hypothetical protein
MKLLGSRPPTTPVTAEGGLISRLPTRRLTMEKISDQTGTGRWYDGRVLFISDHEVIIVPTRCRASTVFSAASRMPRAAKPALPKRKKRTRAHRIHSVLVELVEHGA